jgi:putative DNA primase/helicase
MSYKDQSLDLTDIGIGEIIADQHGDALRYIASADQWLTWNPRDRRWRDDDVLERYELAKVTADTLMDGAHNVEDDKARKAAVAAAIKARAWGRMTSALSCAGTLPRIASRREWWDADPYLLHTASGIVDLRSGRVREANPGDLMRISTGVKVEGDCPRWERFLGEIFCGDKELMEYVRICCGMSLFGDQRDHVALFCLGIGSNGKSTFLGTLRSVLGEHARLAVANLISWKANEGHSTDSAHLFGARMVCVDEVKASALDESKIKRLTGGGEMTARFMHSNNVTERLKMTLWIDGNAAPKIVGTDKGIWRRIKVIPFKAHFDPESADCDKNLPETLRAEAPGILAWCVRAARDYLRNGLPHCAAVTHAVAEYQRDQDVLAEWLEICCDVSPGVDETSAQLWYSCQMYLERAGLDRGWHQRRMTEELKRRGIAEPIRKEGARRLRGLCLVPNWREKLNEMIGISGDGPRPLTRTAVNWND